MIDGQKFFDQKVENDIRTYDNIRKITIGLGMIKQLVVYQIILISKNILSYLQKI